MKKLTILAMLLITVITYAQDNLAQATIKGVLTGNQGQVVQLAEAFSEDQYDWRPSEGVSSVGEALLHVAGANYFLAMKMGFPPPDDVDMMAIGKITGKDNIIAALKKSNEFVLSKIMMVENDDLSTEVDFGFAKMNKMGGLLAMMEHNGEHKGQLIAYARSNGVVPPWSK
ncbi:MULTISPECIES: DinB family protein [Croceitalea]|uniref:DinB family protein n=1 Tax=Croceitalea vernalis TaxID=3075599 RepID=A0ABU3BGC5_9FLAO|nr:MULTISPECIES: DinB family protein [unclassified Croceitalea]MDT0539437.1 DinB family protein [Croceitalea sp. P059]MDT0621230.1 DinB family protein [Croceitalea sp. P007]